MQLKTCKTCTLSFQVDKNDEHFYEKLQIPAPSFCPDCREQRRLVFRNDRHYYQRTCDLCKKTILSLYDPARIQNVYCLTCWWSDRWDPSSYGREYDFGRTFSEQYRKLLEETPKLTMMNDNGIASQNCEYTTDFAFGKNCYMVLSSWYDEDCLFGFQINHDKNCIDNTFVNYSQFMYDCTSSENSYGCEHCTQCFECSDCIFGFDLKNCSDCLLSAGLRNKRYCIWNIEYSREEFFEKKKALQLDHYDKREENKNQFAQFILRIPRKFANLNNCEDSTGENLVRCKNAQHCFNFSDLRDCKFMTNGDQGKDSYDCNSTGRPELCYDCITPDNAYYERFSINCWQSQYVTYSDNCQYCQNIFGCANMKRSQYCILNKQYSKEEYEALIPKIIEQMTKNGEWGDFFSPSVTLFAYNETAAQEWFPSTKEKTDKLGYRWTSEESGAFGKESIKWEEVPGSIHDFDEIITKEIFACLRCKRNYRILPQEFEFYKDRAIPLPRLCMHCRHEDRSKRLCPKKLWERPCMKCHQIVTSAYEPSRPEIVYCENCYLATVY